MYTHCIAPGTGSTDGYLGMREGKKELEAKDPKCMLGLVTYKSMQKHKVNEILLPLILILFSFVMGLD